jgi:hypothetical protein
LAANETGKDADGWTTVTVPGDDLTAPSSRKHSKEFLIRNLSLATEYEVSVQVRSVILRRRNLFSDLKKK